MLDKYEVDVYLSGHVHTFERSFPVVDNNVRFAGGDSSSKNNDSDSDSDGAGAAGGPIFGAASKMLYDEPAAPVHIVNGAGGNIEVYYLFLSGDIGVAVFFMREDST